jgi:hypothetical protein
MTVWQFEALAGSAVSLSRLMAIAWRWSFLATSGLFGYVGGGERASAATR